MWNPFKAPLPAAVRSGSPAQYGYPAEHLAMPSEVTLDDADYPENTGIDGGVTQWRSTTGELFQATNPEYNRPYVRHLDSTPGPRTTFTELAPAPGSTDLAFPRDQGGIPGTNSLLSADGPVTGEDYANWTGKRAELPTSAIGNNGPVVGGPDYSSQLSAAFYQQQAAQFAQQYSEAAMVSAV